ncbi:glycosyltransferase family 9 protein [Olleya sp. YS]|uniref:glycosyltransferase family 9 protein n=1 Tax=Olleya sp. YS TaxID=3028318 RepID=UPI0024341646|nr:glycosyltransferase family 9 protein [Olleya sp. YS]WGD35750.1 glycosyltransferase family 9 protein [Olleya sp. YS]
MTNTPKHILVIRLSAMGDVAMTVPVLRAVTEQYPEVKLTVLTRPFFAPFFRNLENVTVFPIDLKDKHKGVLGLYKLSKTLKQLDIDAVADLHNVLRTKILKVFLLEKPFKQIDKGRTEKRALIKGEVFKSLKSTHQRYADVFETLGLKIELQNPTFPEKKSIPEPILSKVDILNKRQWIGIAPFAQYPSKMYPLHLLKEVINNLKEDYTIFLFGGQTEKEQLDALTLSNKNVINIAGQFDLKQELDIISNLDIMVSMDSGNAHIAAMLGLRVLTIWGVTHPYAGFGAFNQPESYHLVPNRKVYDKTPTSVYGNAYPEHYKDIAGSIKPNVIVDKIKAMLTN